MDISVGVDTSFGPKTEGRFSISIWSLAHSAANKGLANNKLRRPFDGKKSETKDKCKS